MYHLDHEKVRDVGFIGQNTFVRGIYSGREVSKCKKNNARLSA